MFGCTTNSELFNFIADQHNVAADILAKHAATSANTGTEPDGT